ncbi:hypothetical protein PWT90_06785 [Aphanocladium album]|nr:hypothetical protein PWT90_06785 [Aphanocladium album]
MPASNSFGLQCLDKSTLYASSNTTAYLGCCTVDPATTDDGICPDDKIRPATFDPDAYSKILSQECMGHDANVMWYTCSGTAPPFLGCCAVNPCAKGSCPQAALKPARLSSNERNASSFLEGISSTNNSATATVTSTTTEPAHTSSATPSGSTPAGSSGSSHRAMQPATVAGIAIGIAAGSLAIALLVFWCVRRRRASAKRDAMVAAAVSPMGPNTDSTAPLTPAWFYSPSSTHPTNSTFASEYHRQPADSPHPMPPNYEAVTKKTVGPAELPGNLCFELDGDSPRSPHSR